MSALSIFKISNRDNQAMSIEIDLVSVSLLKTIRELVPSWHLFVQSQQWKR